MVLIGVFFALWRRGRDREAISVQQFSERSVAADSALCNFSHRTISHGLHAPDAWLALRFPFATARHHRDLHSALSAFRQVLPYLPASRATRRGLLQESRSRRRTGPLRAMWRALWLANADGRSESSAGRARHPATRWRTALTIRMSALRAAARTLR